MIWSNINLQINNKGLKFNTDLMHPLMAMKYQNLSQNLTVKKNTINELWFSSVFDKVVQLLKTFII